MPQVKVPQLRRNNFLHDLRCRFVREMPVAADDALLDAPRAPCVVLEHLAVVIGLQHENICRADTLEDQLGCMAEIREEANISFGRMHEESDGIIGIMRDGKRIHGNVSQLETGPGIENAEVELELQLGLDGFPRETVAVNWDIKFGREAG